MSSRDRPQRGEEVTHPPVGGRASRRGGQVHRLRALCLALPEAVEKPFGGHTSPSFRVGDKLFVMISEDRTVMTCKGAPGVQQELVAAEPDRFFVPAYVGHKGWVGARLDVEQDWDELGDLIIDSYRMTAPKRLVELLDAPNP